MPAPGGAPAWRPTADWVTLRQRAALLAQVRAFFAARQVLEVDTPLLGPAPTSDPHQHCFALALSGARTGYLQPSPEYAMKCLLAAGSGSIYQVCKAFRADEQGARHALEFTLIEWYRVRWDYRALMDEVDLLVSQLLGCAPALRLSYQQLFQRYCAVDPWLTTDDTLWRCLAQSGVDSTPAVRATGRSGALDLLLTRVIEPSLRSLGAVLVYDYPPSQAALARLRPEAIPVAERFELYVHGLELANGFGELTDAAEQRQRFVADNVARRAQGLPEVPLDERLLAALAQGLPECAGVALGFDRLVMLATGQSDIRAVQAFTP